jgi:hypothetical protein
MCQPCPVCGREALAVIDQKTSERINLYGMYRHERNGSVRVNATGSVSLLVAAKRDSDDKTA